MEKKKNAALKEDDEGVARTLQQLRRERDLLKEAQLKVELGENLYPSLRALVLKWRRGSELMGSLKGKHPRKCHTTTEVDPSSAPLHSLGGAEGGGGGGGGQRRKAREAEALMRDLERSFQLAREEEERLKLELSALKGGEAERAKRGARKESRRPYVKLKKSKSSFDEFKYAAMKKKYKDVLRHLEKVEAETAHLTKENAVLHSALKEEDRFALRQRAAVLEQEIVNRDAYIKECEKVVKNFNQLRDENIQLRKLIQVSMNELEEKKIEEENQWKKEREAEKERRKEDVDEMCEKVEGKTGGEKGNRMGEEERWTKEEFASEFLKKLNETKMVYERAISGYKEELSAGRERFEALQLELRSSVERHDEKEKKMADQFRTELRKFKSEADSNNEDKRREGSTLLKLETLLSNKEVEVATLKEELEALRAEARMSVAEKLEERVCGKLEELVARKRSREEEEEAWLPLKDTLRACFDNLEKRNDETFRKKEAFLLTENKSLKDNLKFKVVEFSALKKDLEDARKEVNKWTLKCELLEAKALESAAANQSMEAVKELRLLLKESQAKLSDAQSVHQTSLTENMVLSERLERKAAELAAERGRVSDIEDRIRDGSSVAKKHDQDVKRLEDKIELLESQIEKKNKILERNSAQLEDKIRDYSSMAARMEHSREDHQKQMLSLKTSNEDSNLECKMRDLQAQNAKLESQLRLLRTEKSHHEKTNTRELRSLQDQVSQLKLRNATLQKHLDVIQVTYKSMFALEGSSSSWPPNGTQVPTSCVKTNFNFEMPNLEE